MYFSHHPCDFITSIIIPLFLKLEKNRDTEVFRSLWAAVTKYHSLGGFKAPAELSCIESILLILTVSLCGGRG